MYMTPQVCRDALVYKVNLVQDFVGMEIVHQSRRKKQLVLRDRRWKNEMEKRPQIEIDWKMLCELMRKALDPCGQPVEIVHTTECQRASQT